jgi:hypothetical protein
MECEHEQALLPKRQRFFRWAEGRGPSLESINAAAVSVYMAEIAVTKSSRVAGVYVTPIRGVLRHLAESGVLATGPYYLPAFRHIIIGAAIGGRSVCVLHPNGWVG